jgi:hypothetical protein
MATVTGIATLGFSQIIGPVLLLVVAAFIIGLFR